MKCPECEAAGQESTVRVINVTSTLAAFQTFFDAAGKRHDHDPNERIERCVCSAGHSFSVENKRKCWCGWERS